MSIVRKPAQKSAQWAKWDDTNGRWILGDGTTRSPLVDRSRFYFWLGAAAEYL